MVATCLRAVVAQRLCRLNCDSCTREVKPSVQERAWLTVAGGEEGGRISVRRGAGCARCNGTGYRERTGLYEIFVMDDALIEAAMSGGGVPLLAAARASMAGNTLASHAFALVREGRTSVAEAMHVVNAGED
jgi:MSHA biogenesis protein MshE